MNISRIPEGRVNNVLICHLARFPLFLSGICYITPGHYSLSEKLVAALIVTGECEAETIANRAVFK